MAAQGDITSFQESGPNLRRDYPGGEDGRVANRYPGYGNENEQVPGYWSATPAVGGVRQRGSADTGSHGNPITNPYTDPGAYRDTPTCSHTDAGTDPGTDGDTDP